MIDIDFKISYSPLFQFERTPIAEVDAALFTSTLFIMPVRFRIGNIELFEVEGDPWSPAPIMCLATEVVEIIKNLKITKKKLYMIIEGPGDIEFSMIDNENVHIDFDGYNHIVTTVKYNELLNALLIYANKVRNFLLDNLPQMKNHPYWGPWLCGELD